MPVQNPGVTSLFALHNLHKTERQMGTSIERLSSGKELIMRVMMLQVEPLRIDDFPN